MDLVEGIVNSISERKDALPNRTSGPLSGGLRHTLTYSYSIGNIDFSVPQAITSAKAIVLILDNKLPRTGTVSGVLGRCASTVLPVEVSASLNGTYNQYFDFR
ncbi:hypothetical protein CBL_06839 [Carabus blaptoides fortunei]